MAEVATYPSLKKPRRYSDLAAAMNGQGAFAPTPEMPTPELNANYGFGDLAGYEEQRRSNFGNLSSQAIGQYGDLVGLAGEDLKGQIQQNQGQQQGVFDTATNRLGTDMTGLQGSINDITRNKQGQIGSYVSDFGTRSTDRRSALAKSLADIGSQTFSMNTPAMLEDLQRRGLASSASEVGNSASQALKEIALRNQEQLLNYDTQAAADEERLREMGLQTGLSGQDQLGQTNQDLFSRRQALSQSLADRQYGNIDELSQLDKDAFNRQADIQGSALSANLQAQQDALDSGLDLRRGGLEAQRADAQSAAERQQANELANKERQNGITQSLIGAGGSILGSAIGKGLLGGASAATGSGAAGASSGLAGVSPLALGAAGVGAQLFQSNQARKSMGVTNNEANALMAVPGGATQLGLIKGIGNVANDAIGGGAVTAGNILTAGKGAVTAENIVNAPAKAIKNVVKSLCFDANTPVTMSDGSTTLIKDIDVGAMTKGGVVESVRKSLTVEGTRYNYHGVIVSGSHAVLEGDEWKRVEDSNDAIPVPGPGIVYCLVTDKHRIYVGDITFADEHETDFYEDLTIQQSLEYLNAEQSGRTMAEVG